MAADTAPPAPVQRFTPAPRGLTFEQLMSQAAASSTPSFAPKCLPSMGPDSEDDDASGSDGDVKPLSRGDIEREIAGGRIARVTNMTELD